jgi:hypothetical protein
MVSAFLFIGPRIGGTFWLLARPLLWQVAFSSWLWPLFGLLLLPWTTLMYVLVFIGGVTGSEWLWIALGAAVDLASYFGRAYGSLNRSIEMKSYWNPY